MRVQDIARAVGGKVEGEGEREIEGIASLDSATARDLSFAEDRRALARARGSQAGCILAPEGASLPGRTIIAVACPKWAFVRAAEILRSVAAPSSGVHPTAIVAADAHLAPDVSVGPHVVIEPGVRVGAGTRLGAGVFLGAGARVGARCIFYPGVIIYAGAEIGNRVILHAGVVVGSDGFGYVFAEGRQHKFPQQGGVVIEDDVEIGSNSTVDRGSLGVTVIGEGTKIDNLVQVAHNVRIGRHCVIAAQAGISGSAEVGDYVMIGGQAGVGDHARIEDRAAIGGQAGILPGKIVRKGSIVWGTPSRPLNEFKETYAHLARLPALARRLKELEKK